MPPGHGSLRWRRTLGGWRSESALGTEKALLERAQPPETGAIGMGAGCSTLCLPASSSLIAFAPKTIAVSDSATPTSNYKPKLSSRFASTTIFFSRPHLRTPHRSMDLSSSSSPVPSSSLLPVRCGTSDELEKSRDKATAGQGSGAPRAC
ncbi:hypothetical protein COCNU_12G003890 [Cocos nucifera]|uniref:Uncharacterized protein n=1 Tax=Cocos nucifera TaxID=13894 RepID=A0A8K0N9W9_COCNU|nr:hypothetical protein COCNU_12G003890 [Cocos nucifera]